MATLNGHLCCHFCHAYGVERLYLGSAHVDSCHCPGCGARWHEDSATGSFRGLADADSILVQRDPG
jgi:hypothetical protein